MNYPNIAATPTTGVRYSVIYSGPVATITTSLGVRTVVTAQQQPAAPPMAMLPPPPPLPPPSPPPTPPPNFVANTSTTFVAVASSGGAGSLYAVNAFGYTSGPSQARLPPSRSSLIFLQRHSSPPAPFWVCILPE